MLHKKMFVCYNLHINTIIPICFKEAFMLRTFRMKNIFLLTLACICMPILAQPKKMDGFEIQMQYVDEVFGQLDIKGDGKTTFYQYTSSVNVLPAWAVVLNTKNIFKWFNKNNLDDASAWNVLLTTYKPESAKAMADVIFARKSHLIDTELDRQIAYAQGILQFATANCLPALQKTYLSSTLIDENSLKTARTCLTLKNEDNAPNFVSSWMRSTIERCAGDASCKKQKVSTLLMPEL